MLSLTFVAHEQDGYMIPNSYVTFPGGRLATIAQDEFRQIFLVVSPAFWGMKTGRGWLAASPGGRIISLEQQIGRGCI